MEDLDTDWMDEEEWKEELEKLRDQDARMNEIAAYHVNQAMNILALIALIVLLIAIFQ